MSAEVIRSPFGEYSYSTMWISLPEMVLWCYNLPADPLVGVAAPEIGVLVPEARLGGWTSRHASALSGCASIVSNRPLKYFRQLAFEGTKCPVVESVSACNMLAKLKGKLTSVVKFDNRVFELVHERLTAFCNKDRVHKYGLAKRFTELNVPIETIVSPFPIICKVRAGESCLPDGKYEPASSCMALCSICRYQHGL